MAIIKFRPEHKKAFRDLNLAWIREHFWVEEKDTAQTNNPEECLAGGGEIFFGLENETGEAVATCALYRLEEGVFELAKMAVRSDQKGKGWGNELMAAAEAWARERGAKKILILSNTVLEPAINLYRKHGFHTVREGQHRDYQRCNIVMEKIL
jgi:putative acetyltransferase